LPAAYPYAPRYYTGWATCYCRMPVARHLGTAARTRGTADATAARLRLPCPRTATSASANVAVPWVRRFSTSVPPGSSRAVPEPVSAACLPARCLTWQRGFAVYARDFLAALPLPFRHWFTLLLPVPCLPATCASVNAPHCGARRRLPTAAYAVLPCHRTAPPCLYAAGSTLRAAHRAGQT